jgi:hypothetical protein
MTTQTPKARRAAPVLTLALLIGTAPALLAQAGFDPRDLEWKEMQSDKLELTWARPKHPKWSAKTTDVGNGRELADYITRAESPSARPDMSMLIFGWEVAGNYRPTDFPAKDDDELKSIISRDPVLARPENKEKANSIVKKFSVGEGERVDQREILDRLLSYKDRKDIRHFGRDLERILDLYEDGDYIQEVPLNQKDPGGLIKYYWGISQHEFERPKFLRAPDSTRRASKPMNVKIGRRNRISAKTFSVSGLHKNIGAKVVIEYYTFSCTGSYTMAIRIIYFGGMEDSTEIQIIKKMILATLDEM